jgi:hypothetical protein
MPVVPALGSVQNRHRNNAFGLPGPRAHQDAASGAVLFRLLGRFFVTTRAKLREIAERLGMRRPVSA